MTRSPTVPCTIAAKSEAVETSNGLQWPFEEEPGEWTCSPTPAPRLPADAGHPDTPRLFPQGFLASFVLPIPTFFFLLWLFSVNSEGRSQ